MLQVGLDNAGKTTILYKLSLGEVVVSQATVGSNVELVKYKNIQLEVGRTGVGGWFKLSPAAALELQAHPSLAASSRDACHACLPACLRP